MVVWLEKNSFHVNTNNGTEGNWNGLKKAVCGTAGATSSLPVKSVVPSLLRFLSDKSKEEASFWRVDTKRRCEKTGSAMYNFPALPSPIKEDWDHLQGLLSCYLLEPLEERWGRWVTWKCTCPSFFSGALYSQHATGSPL